MEEGNQSSGYQCRGEALTQRLVERLGSKLADLARKFRKAEAIKLPKTR